MPIIAIGHTRGIAWSHTVSPASRFTLFELDLSAALADTQQRAQWLHQQHPGVRYIIYMTPLEMTTVDIDSNQDGVVDSGKEGDSLALQHPEWAQVGLDGRAAVFYGSLPGMPFWVGPSDEDVWVSPAQPGFRAALLNQIGRLAVETELDGIWHDVPFLLGEEFGSGWVGQFPDVSVEARTLFTAASIERLSRSPVARFLTSTWPSFSPRGPTISCHGRPIRSMPANLPPARLSVSS